jgi:hypothetical protein
VTGVMAAGVGQMSVGRTVFDPNSAALSFLLKFDTVR